MKKVLIIAYCFPPYAGAGVHRTVRFVKYLKKIGWQISVLTVEEMYFRSSQMTDRAALNKLPQSIRIYRTRVFRGMTALVNLRNRFRGSRRKRAAENPIPFGKNSKPAKRSWLQKVSDGLSSIFAIPDNEVGWLPFAVPAGRRIIQQDAVDVLYSSGPPHTCHLIAYCLKRLTSKPWVADFRDPWSRNTWKKQKGKLYRKSQAFLERIVVERADRVILNTDHMQKEFADFYKDEPRHKFVTITNGFDPEDFAAIEPGDAVRKKPFTLTHTGTLYKKRDPSHLLLAIRNLAKRGIISPDDFQLNLVGAISIKDVDVRKVIAEYGLTGFVNLVPPVSHYESLAYLAQSHVLLIIQPDTVYQIPGKIFEYIYLKKPILSLSHDGATSDIIEKNNLGKVVPADDVAGIEKALFSLYQETFQIENHEDVLKIYNGETLTKKLASVLSECIKTE